MKLILSLAIVLSFMLLPVRAEEVIKEYSGDGFFSTEPITVPDNWVVQWEFTGVYFQILINTDQNVPLGYAAEQKGSGEGSSVQPKGGTYILDMNGAGKWKVRILKGK